jgi:HD-like signal output (HDOD) protein
MSTTPVAADQSQTIKLALSRIGDIATLPEVTAKIISVVDDPKSTARDLHQIIKNDPALATKILKVVNSAFYGLPGQVAEVERAIVLLGLSAVKNIAISASISRLFKAEKVSDTFSARDVWRHCVAVAVASREFCAMIGKKAHAEEAFLAGLIADLGLLVERQAFPDQLKEVIRMTAQSGRPFVEVEKEIVGADHQALGAALAAKWKFPKGLQVVLGYHHKVDKLKEEARLLPTLVYIADTLCCYEKIGFHMPAENQPLEDTHLESVGLTEDDFNSVRERLNDLVEEAEAILR